MGVSVDTQSDSSSFVKKPRSPVCHNASDCFLPRCLHPSPSFPVAPGRLSSLPSLLEGEACRRTESAPGKEQTSQKETSVCSVIQ